MATLCCEQTCFSSSNGFVFARILELHKRIPRMPQEQEMVKREIDWLVYELYGLTEEEVRIVEGT